MNAEAVIDDYLDALLDCAPRAMRDAAHGDAAHGDAETGDSGALDAATLAPHAVDSDAAQTPASVWPAPAVPATVGDDADAALHGDAVEADAVAADAVAVQASTAGETAACEPADLEPTDVEASGVEAADVEAALVDPRATGAHAVAAPAFDGDDLAAALMAEFDACDAPPAVAAPIITAAVPAVAAPAVTAPAACPAPVAAPAATALPATATAAHQAQLALHAAISTANASHVAANHRWIRVAVGHDSYALELLRVQEVVRVAPIVAMRGAGSCVLGVMNLRGRIVPVFDLGLWLGTACVQTDERSRIVVVERDDELIGVLVTAVDNVVTLGRERIEPPLPGSVPGAMVGIARVGPVPTVLLDANALFG